MKQEFKELLHKLEIKSSQRIYEPSDKIRLQVPTEYDHILTVNVVYNILRLMNITTNMPNMIKI